MYRNTLESIATWARHGREKDEKEKEKEKPNCLVCKMPTLGM